MADLQARLKPLKSSTAGEVPTTADIAVAELAINTADAMAYVRHTDDAIKQLVGAITIGNVPSTAASTGRAGEVRADSSYLYICTATDTWLRVAIASW